MPTEEQAAAEAAVRLGDRERVRRALRKFVKVTPLYEGKGAPRRVDLIGRDGRVAATAGTEEKPALVKHRIAELEAALEAFLAEVLGVD